MYDLGLEAAAFWRMTPRELDALTRRHRASEERMDRRFAMLATLYAESHRDKDKRSEPFTLEDFLPAPARGHGRVVAIRQAHGPMAPCPECDTPRWKGHLAQCSIGRAHFAGQVAQVRTFHADFEAKLDFWRKRA